MPDADPNALPTPDEAQAIIAQSRYGAGLPNPDALLASTAQTGAAHDNWWANDVVNPMARAVNAFGQGFNDNWGARPLGLDPETETTLKKLGVINDYSAGHTSFMKGVNEFFIRPAAAAADLSARMLSSQAAAVSAGLEAAAAPEGEEPKGFFPTASAAAGELVTGIASGAVGPESAAFAPELEEAVAASRAGRTAEIANTASEARASGVVGEGEAGFYGAQPVSPENVQARAEAAHEAGIEPPAPEPPAPDIHALARRIDPETFEQYDAAALEREQHRDTIAAIREERANSPEALEAQDQIDTILGKVGGVESRLTNAARTRLTDAQDRLDTAMSTDTPEMAQARAGLMNADFAMRDLAPQVSDAYRQAREMMPAETVVAPDMGAAEAGTAPEAPRESEPPHGAAGEERPPTAAAEPQRTPEEEAGIRAAPVEAGTPEGEAAVAPPNVVGEERLGERKTEPVLEGPLADIRPSPDDPNDVIDSNFTHGRIVGNEIVPTESLSGGTAGGPSDKARVTELASRMSSPNGYFARLVVDHEGNVVEGQHRLDAARELGLAHVPITRIEDLNATFPEAAVRQAIRASAPTHGDHVTQIVNQLSDAIHDVGTAHEVREQYEAPRGYETQWTAGLDAIEKAEQERAHRPEPVPPAEAAVSQVPEEGGRLSGGGRTTRGAIKPVEGTGETVERGLSQHVEEKAIEEGITEGFGDLPEYRRVSMADQAARVTELMDADYEHAKAVAMGDRAPPAGVLPESVYVGVEKRALAEGDVDTIRQLATRSRLNTAATTMGQRIRSLGERDAASPVNAIRDIQAAREAAVGKGRDLAAEKAQAVTEARAEMRKAASKPDAWKALVDSLTCAGEG